MPKVLKKSFSRNSGDSGDNEVQTIFSDLVTFVMMLFILLFVLSYSDTGNTDFITEFQIKFGERVEEKQETLTTDALIVSKIEHYIENEKLEDYVHVVVDEYRLKVIMNPPLLFESGKANIKKKGMDILAGFGASFDTVINPLVIEGHTDSVPINNDEFGSNWELSFFRAYSVIKYYINRRGYNPSRVSALGYGEFRPIMPNDSKESRALNRRIEINIIRIKESDGGYGY